MKILLTGAAGQLGHELLPRLQNLGEVVATDLDGARAMVPGCQKLDLSNAGALETFLNRLQPDLVVNTAAFTAVDLAEDQAQLAFTVNAEAPGRIARWAERNQSQVLHYSTDYIFDGSSTRPYQEQDTPSPLSIYGESKLAGEQAIAASGCRYQIIRTSWVYSAHGSNFMLNMLKLARRGLQLSVVNDQIGCPTWARNLAQASVQLLKAGQKSRGKNLNRVFHYCDATEVSWYEFARLVFDTAVRLDLLKHSPVLSEVASAQYPQKAQRPVYSVLDTRAIRGLGVRPAPLAESVEQCMKEWKETADE